jgi:hypothetical protein
MLVGSGLGECDPSSVSQAWRQVTRLAGFWIADGFSITCMRQVYLAWYGRAEVYEGKIVECLYRRLFAAVDFRTWNPFRATTRFAYLRGNADHQYRCFCVGKGKDVALANTYRFGHRSGCYRFLVAGCSLGGAVGLCLPDSWFTDLYGRDASGVELVRSFCHQLIWKTVVRKLCPRLSNLSMVRVLRGTGMISSLASILTRWLKP